MGVGTLGIVDNDTVSRSNLHRQVLYDDKDVGQPKVIVAIQKLHAQNPDTNLVPHSDFLNKKNALELIGEYDTVVDATDNFPTRYLLCMEPYTDMRGKSVFLIIGEAQPIAAFILICRKKMKCQIATSMEYWESFLES